MMWAKAPIYMRKGVAAPAPETNQKWLERTREGGPCVLRHIVIWNLYKGLAANRFQAPYRL
jgi:hypothetical protein